MGVVDTRGYKYFWINKIHLTSYNHQTLPQLQNLHFIPLLRLFQVKMEREEHQSEIRDLQDQLSEMHDELDCVKHTEDAGKEILVEVSHAGSRGRLAAQAPSAKSGWCLFFQREEIASKRRRIPGRNFQALSTMRGNGFLELIFIWYSVAVLSSACYLGWIFFSFIWHNISWNTFCFLRGHTRLPSAEHDLPVRPSKSV